MKFVLVKDLDELSEAFKQQMLKYMYSFTKQGKYSDYDRDYAGQRI